MGLLIGFFYLLSFLNLVYLFVLNSVYFITSLVSFGALRKYTRRLKSLSIEKLLSSAGAPPISLLVPSYNEELTCVEAVRALLNLQYPEYEILIINDGSKDQTLTKLLEAYEMEEAARMPVADLPMAMVKNIYKSKTHDNLWIIDKENGGKADALNAGLNFCETPLFCAIDADSLLERDALLRVVRPFLESGKTIASGGIIRIVNGCKVERGEVKHVGMPKTFIERLQVLEYLRAFLSGRMGWNVLGGTFIISGAFGLFRRPLVVQAGGYNNETVGEDMELIVRLHRYCLENKVPYEITFIPDPVAWTECPSSWRILRNQRDRWQRGLAEVLGRHLPMCFNPRYGRVGLLAYPYYFFLEMLGPVIEVTGYLSVLLSLLLGSLSLPFFLAFFLIAVIYGCITSFFAVALEELTFRRYTKVGDLMQLFMMAFWENFGYRQLLSFWRFQGMLSLLFKRQKGWGGMNRKGFESTPQTLS